MKQSRLADLCESVVFVGILVFFCIGTVFGLSGFVELNEKRNLAELPKINSMQSLAQVPLGIDAYVDDHLAYRSDLIFADSLIRIRYFGAQPFGREPKMLIGRSGWLFLASFKNAYDQGTFSTSELFAYSSAVAARQRFYANQSISYRMFIVPDKFSIYPEFLPLSQSGDLHGGHAQQFYAYGRHVGELQTLIFVKDDLLRNKPFALPSATMATYGEATTSLFYKYDHHWTNAGGYIGYVALMDSLHRIDACFRPMPLSAFTITKQEAPKDVADLLALSPLYHEQAYFFTMKSSASNPCPNQRLLIAGDSFMAQTINAWLQEQGLSFEFVNILYDDTSSSDKIKAAVEEFRPTIIVQEFGELRFDQAFAQILKSPQI